MRKYATSMILAATLPLGELHTFWERDTRVQNWILDRTVPMTIQWNVKYLTDQVWWILVFIAMLLYVENRINKATALSFLVFSVLDLFMYIYNFKTYDYGYVYFIIAIIWIIFYKWKR